MVETWRVPVESRDWMGPISIMQGGVETAFPWKTQLVLQGEYPDDDGWEDPILDPLSLTVGKGIQLEKMEAEDAGVYDLCIQITPPSGDQQPVLKEVATVVRY